MKRESIIKKVVTIILLFLLLIVFIFPFYCLVINSFKTDLQFTTNPMSLPTHISFLSYIDAFNKMNFTTAFMNSFIITLFSIILISLFAAMTAYVTVRKKFKISQIIFYVMVASMIIPFQAIMIPVVKIYGHDLNLLNHKSTLIYLYIGFGLPLAVFIYHGFIKSIPLELEEAANIDGCTKYGTFFKIVVPLLKPTTATIFILNLLWIWNDYLLPSIVLTKPEFLTLPLSTYAFYGSHTIDYQLMFSALMMVLIPILIMYLILQKSIIEGITQGSIK